MTEPRLTSGDVCEIAGIPQPTLDRWVNAGLLGPVGGGRSGAYRVYTLVHALAAAAGARYRAEGAGPDRVAGMVRYVGSRRLDWLEAEFRAGRTFPVPGALLGTTWLPGMMVEPPADPALGPTAAALMRRLNLAATYAAVRRKSATLSRRTPNRVGRSRGLARKARGKAN